MSAPILTTASSILCPHGGRATLISSAAQLTVGGARPLLISDTHPIVGCSNPAPCLTLRWTTGASSVMAHGLPIVTQANPGVCYGGTPSPATIAQTQLAASAL